MTHTRFYLILKDYLELNDISNTEFATRIGITPKHLIEILLGKSELTLSLIESISIVTGIPKDYILEIESNAKNEDKVNKFLEENNITISNYLSKFHYKELVDKGWITNYTHIDNKMSVILDILKYLRVKDFNALYKLDANIKFKSKNDKQELLLLWLERCYKLSLNQRVSDYNICNINYLVNYIRNCAVHNKFNEDELINKFNEYGIKLVIEDDLPSSKIRGAFKVHKNIPSIYITHKHQRIADIYFTLLHELSHCKSDFNKAKATNIVIYSDEEIVDKQALNWMVDDIYYNKVILDKNYDINKEENYPKCFIVYRLAMDNNIKYSSKIYQENNPLISSI